MSNFEAILKRVISHEGGFTANPVDPGNWTGGKKGVGELKGTKYGISAASYPMLDIENMSWADARDLYWTWYKELKLYQFRAVMQYQMFDAAFNHGMRKACQLLQRAVKVTDDGIVGAKTREALSEVSDDDIAMLFLAQRLRFYTKLEHFDEFGRGWSERVAKSLEYAAADN